VEANESLRVQLVLARTLLLGVAVLAVLTFLLLFWRTRNIGAVCVPSSPIEQQPLVAEPLVTPPPSSLPPLSLDALDIEEVLLNEEL